MTSAESPARLPDSPQTASVRASGPPASPLPSKLVLLSMALVIAIGAWLRLAGLSDQLFLHKDDSLNVILAQTLHREGVYLWSIARPGYLTLLGAAYALVGDGPKVGMYLSALLGIAALPLVYLLGASMFDRRVGLLAAACIAVSSVHIFYSKVQHPMAAAVLLVLCATILYWQAERRGDPADSAMSLAAGLLLGAGVTMHYALLPLPVLFVAAEAVWWLSRRGLADLKWHPEVLRAGAEFLAAYTPARRNPGRRLLMLLGGVAFTLLLMQLVTQGRQPPPVTHFDYFNQLRDAFAYQSQTTQVSHHVRGWQELPYYPLAIGLAEGALAALVLSGTLLLGSIAFLRRPRFELLILLFLTLGLLAIWTAAGFLGSAHHLRAVVAGLPSACVLVAWALSRLIAHLQTRVGAGSEPAATVLNRIPVVPLATGLILVAGALAARPLTEVKTGYAAAAADMTERQTVKAFGGHDRIWNALLGSGRGANLDSLDALAQDPSGDGPASRCYLAVEVTNDALNKFLQPTPEKIQQAMRSRLDKVAERFGGVPVRAYAHTHFELALFLFEGSDTSVAQLLIWLRSGVPSVEDGRWLRVLYLEPAEGYGC